MNFFKDRDLASRLRNQLVSSKEKLLYFLFFIVLTYCTSLVPQSSQDINYIESFTLIIIEIIGLVVCYQTNRKGDDKEFIERYICLYMPVIIQTSLAIILTTFILGIVLGVILNHSYISNLLFSNQEMFKFLISSIFLIYFYIRMKKAIEIASAEVKTK